MGILDKMRVGAGPAPSGAETDPVCGMKVDPARAAGTSEHAGKTYFFCSPGCKAKFDREPAKFLQSGPVGH